MKCPECGSENKDGAVFCKICGTSLTVKTSPAPNKSNSDSIESSKNIKSENQSVKNNNSKPKSNSNKNTLIICITAILCVAIVAGALIYLNPDILSNSDNTQLNETTSQASNSGSVGSFDSSNSVSIQFSDFYTGSSASDKTYCSANIGAQHYGETYQISVLYSREGSNLNDGSLVKKTVDNEGFLHVSSSNAFSYYPDKAIVTIYDMNENVLDEETYYLDPVSGQQSYNN